MSGPRIRRTAPTRARTPWGRVLLVLLMVSATFALFCVDAPTERATGGAAPAAAVSAASTVDATGSEMRAAAGPAHHAGRQPCEEDPGGHHCHGPAHHGVAAQAPLVGADRSTAPGQPVNGPVGRSVGPSREPGAARPPDLHQLQLLRV
ncbi:hypothetical protein GCM10010145_19390 [Streptomyces ruber]|uniref:Uncharacterized protein n=2 Tax=Streptomyces TaxID=1883 RepID=A0A918EPQ9_9ACTN|nr:hypothetical protein [Streptomyces ruber]GGQ50501.1 hypothetical protein GCM10010145_19390 [Streptomyces ruber]